MLRRLKTRCWSQHVDAEWTFEDGLIVVRGANESGKSRMILAMVYALGGVKALPLPLTEIVTEGRDVNDLQVELEVEVEGVRYVFTRSPHGAECNHPGGKVVGQNEVSKYAAELFGADMKMLPRLMLAKQNKLRGSLEDGSTAVASQIESLADFDLFDRVVKQITSRRVTGPTTALEKRIGELMEQASRLTVKPLDTFAADALIEALRVQIQEVEAHIAKTLEPAAKAADRAFSSLAEREEQRKKLFADLRDAEASYVERLQKFNDLCAVADQPFDADRYEAAGIELGQAVDAEARRTQYDWVTERMAQYPDTFWEGTEQSLAVEMKALNDSILAVARHIGNVEGDIRVRQAKIVTESLCGYCGQDFSKFPEVAAKNLALTQEIENLQRQHTRALARQVALQNDLKYLQHIQKLAKTHFSLAVNPEWVQVIDSFVPPKYVWRGDPPPAGKVNTMALRTEIAALRKVSDAIREAKAKLPMAHELVEQARAWRDNAAARFNVLEVVDSREAYAALVKAEDALEAARAQLKALRDDLHKAQKDRELLVIEHNHAKRQQEDVQRELDLQRKLYEQQVKSNALLKKVRSARPLVADQLWNQVLQSVSVTTTAMRRAPSVVTKDGDGFKLNGRDVEGYSGSALDLLGLSIRCALMKTFLPHVSLLILDEATAACDDSRTEAMLGYLAASGFNQILLVTHEAISESFAAQVIQL
jgi:DNA repair exonuclease SbcCD ATPase subunit